MAKIDPISRQALSSKIKDRILQLILEGDLRPGDRVVETRIARELGVSQSPVREAIRDLAGIGFVEIEPYRGARVRRFTHEEFLDDMEIRGELEALAGVRAAARISREDVSTLRRLVDEMHAMAEAGDAHGQALANTEFHRIIVEAAASPALLRVWSALEPFARTYATATVPGTDLGWLGDRHAVIVDALEAGNGELVATVMRQHALEARENLASPGSEPSVSEAITSGSRDRD